MIFIVSCQETVLNVVGWLHRQVHLCITGCLHQKRGGCSDRALSHLLCFSPCHPVCLLCVCIQIVQPSHPDAADRTHEGLLARVNTLVDLVLPLVVELFVALEASVQKFTLVLVLAIFPLVPVLVSSSTHGTDVARLILVDGSVVVFYVVFILGLHITAWLGTVVHLVAMDNSDVHIESFVTFDESTTYMTRHNRCFVLHFHMLLQVTGVGELFAAVRTNIILFFFCSHVRIVFVELLHMVDHILATGISKDLVTGILRTLMPPLH